MYRLAAPEIEIVMLPSNSQISYISSTLVREVIIHKGDVTPFVPKEICDLVKK